MSEGSLGKGGLFLQGGRSFRLRGLEIHYPRPGGAKEGSRGCSEAWRARTPGHGITNNASNAERPGGARETSVHPFHIELPKMRSCSLIVGSRAGEGSGRWRASSFGKGHPFANEVLRAATTPSPGPRPPILGGEGTCFWELGMRGRTRTDSDRTKVVWSSVCEVKKTSPSPRLRGAGPGVRGGRGVSGIED